MEEMREMYRNLGISDKIYDYSNDILEGLKERFDNIDKNAEYNQLKVIMQCRKTEWLRCICRAQQDMDIMTVEEIY